jgi:hypothetical protein
MVWEAQMDLARLPSLAADGYTVLRRFAGRRLLSELRHHVELELLEPPTPGCERPHNRLVPLRWNNAIVDRILSDPRHRDRVRDAAEARDLRWISGYISVKDPRTPPLWWHQDWWCWGHPVTFRRGTVQAALVIYLSDTDTGTGALRVLPRTHHASTDLHRLLPVDHAQEWDLDLDHDVFLDRVDQVTLDVAAGDAVLLDYRLLHGTHPNASADRRDAILLSFTPDWDRLPDDIRGHLIQHFALPNDDEVVRHRPWYRELLPRFGGVRRDLPTDRRPPGHFICA